MVQIRAIFALDRRRFLTICAQALLIIQESKLRHNLLLIADPDTEKRQLVVQMCQRFWGNIIDVPSLGEGRRALTNNKVSTVIVAAALADLYEFSTFLQHATGASLIVYGSTRQRLSGPHYLQVLTDDGLRNLTQGFKKRGGDSVAPFSCEDLAQKAEAADDVVILLGASTGGVVALEAILSHFPEDCPPTLIVQHIREGFAESMVRRFDQILRPHVVVAQEAQVLRRGHIYVAVDNSCHLGLIRRGGELQARLLYEPSVGGHCPSVDILFREAAQLAQYHRFRAALLTGMGSDGAKGLQKLQAAGAHTIAQDQESSVVWGMPRAAIDMGAANEVLPLSRIASALLQGSTGAKTKRSA